MNGMDTGNYSNSARFETEVYPGVYWVPLNTLGSSRYTTADMARIAALPLEEKRSRIANLYEAVQLFHASDFRGAMDNVNRWTGDGALWQVHKSPEESVISNEGCCATDTNWLAYFIDGHYDAHSWFCYANEDGNGHITTCIQHYGDFYFLDMMMCRNDSQAFLCRETGDLSELLAGEWSGFLYKCKDPVDFCRFHIDRCAAKKRPIPFCFYIRETPQVYATGLKLDKNGATFLVPASENPRIIYLDEQSAGRLESAKIPERLRNIC